MGQIDIINRTGLMRLRSQWANIAQDIVLTRIPKDDGSGMLMTAEEICEVYKMTKQECLTLLQLPEFKRLVHDFKKRVDAMGDNASITLRAQMLAADMMEDVYTSAKAAGVDPKDKLAAFKVLAQIGGLDPATNGTNRPSKDSGGGGMATMTTVVLNVPAGIPGMEHVYNAKPAIEGEVVSGD